MALPNFSQIAKTVTNFAQTSSVQKSSGTVFDLLNPANARRSKAGFPGLGGIGGLGKVMPNFERAAYDMAFLAYSAQIKPALGTSEELIPDDLPAPAVDRYSRAERESILADGGSVDKIMNEQVFIDRYRTSATTEDGQETTKFDDFSFLLGQSYAVWYFQKALKQFQNAVSYDEDLPQPANSSVPLVNTNILKAAMSQAGLELAQGAYIENLAEFKSTLQVTRASADRFDILAKVNYSNSVYILALGLELVL